MAMRSEASAEIIGIAQDRELDQCLADMAEGRPSALEKLYRLTSAPVYGYALSVLKNRQDAEDVLHDCYVRLYQAAGHYRPCGKPMAWIITVTRNLCLLKLRERGKTEDLSEDEWESTADPQTGTESDDHLILTQCMTQLSDEERQIVVLHAAAGFRHREIADMLGLPLPTVLSKYHRALKKLRTFLEKGDGSCDRTEK